MPIERRIRSIGTKSYTYPWLHRYVIVGPYNRHIRRGVAARALQTGVITALSGAVTLQRRMRRMGRQKK